MTHTIRFPYPFLAMLLLAAVLAGCGGAPEVEVVAPWHGTIEESFSEPARTRLANTYPVTMPVEGRIGRIALEPGDRVEQGEELAVFDRTPLEAEVRRARAYLRELRSEIAVKDDNSLELTGLSNMEALVEATSETLKAARAQVDAQRARLDRTRKELGRLEELAAAQTIPDSRLDDIRLTAETDLSDLRQREYDLAADLAISVAVNLGPRAIGEYMAKKKLERATLEERAAQAQASLDLAEHQLSLARIVAPVGGVVLQRLHQGDGPVTAGTELLVLGDLRELEVLADVLTQDALRLSPGTEVELRAAARREPLRGRVRHIEPAGFTKLSSLGVEQQRVNAIVELISPDAALGVGYRLQARFVTGRREGALLVPRFSVLQRPDGGHSVLKVSGGRLVETPVEIGLRSDLEMEVTSGLTPADAIVVSPDSTLTDGSAVTPKRAAR